MTIFSSGRREKLTADPTPWEVVEDGGYTAYGSREDAILDGFAPYWSPEPEFDRPLTNPASPILRWLRATIRPGMHATAARHILSNWAGTVAILPALGITYFTPEQELHARAVLTRLANLTKEN